MRLIPDHIWGIITVLQEAATEPYQGKVAVAEVILRRTQKKYMSDGTVAGTVLWPMQFSGWNAHDPTPQYRERIESAKADTNDHTVQDCIRAWGEAESGSDTTAGALLYYNPKLANPSWAKKSIETAVIGNHRFMKEV